MSKQAQGWITVAAIAVLMMILWTDWLSATYAFLTSIPWFVYLLMAGIVYCGYRFVSLSKEDHKADQQWIEQEGNIFIRRMNREKEKREGVEDAEENEVQNESS
ncbi:MAG TPA: sporulation YhaL family protein [Bacillales bacterium]|nr:sporulation YhaL family protein [Bacillales bacterium]